jgi:hypothetical protein
MPEEVSFEPFMQCAKPADFDLARNLRMSFAGGLIELNTENVADRVALKCAAEVFANGGRTRLNSAAICPCLVGPNLRRDDAAGAIGSHARQ